LPEDLNEPIFDDYDERDLPPGVRAELRGVAPANAHVIGGHLLMAGALLDKDPAAALEHTLAAKKRGGRLQVVREAVAEAAYAAEDYKLAFMEYQALRRMTDDENYAPVLADCQRAMGKPTEALELLAGIDQTRLNADQRIEAVLVAAGARLELGQSDEAQRLLRSAIATRRGGRGGQSRLRFAYAAALEAAGDVEQAAAWFQSAAEFDPEGGADARRQLDRMAGRPVDDEIDEPSGDAFIVDEELGDDWIALNDDELDEDELDEDDEDDEPEDVEPEDDDEDDEPEDVEPEDDEPEAYDE